MPKTSSYCKSAALFLLLILAVSTVTAQNSPATFSYDEQWKTITKALLETAPDSALRKAEVILKRAEAEKNTVQIIKANVQIMACRLNVDPSSASAQLSRFDSLCRACSKPSDKAVMQSMQAEMLLMYYRMHAYDINKRTDIVGRKAGDLEQWTKTNFTDTIRSLLSTSMQPEEILKNTKIKEYDDLLNKAAGNWIQPTLYEFLANRRVDLLTDLKKVSAEMDFALLPDLAFLPVHRFIKATLDKVEGSDLDREIVQTFQAWLRFRVEGTADLVLLQADLKRVVTLFSLYNTQRNSYEEGENGLNAIDSRYVKTLEDMTVSYANLFDVQQIILEEAKIYRSNYNENDSIRKTFLRKAYDLCEDGIERFPKSYVVEDLRALQGQIRQKYMSILNNGVAKPGTRLDVHLNSRNIEKIALKIYRVNTTATEYSKHYTQKRSPLGVLIESRWIDLKLDSNFCSQNTIIPITTGKYGIYEYELSAEGLPDDPLMGRFVVSDLAFLTQQAELSENCVVDRISGKPIPNVRVNAFTIKRSAKEAQLEPVLVDEQTDKNGMFFMRTSPNKYIQAVIFLEKGADKYLSSDFSLYRRYNRGPIENKQVNLSMYTDRSLYRPGQTVQVKGIAYFLNTNRQEAAPEQVFELSLRDANNKEIAVKSVRTNEFGSFAESFVLPEDGRNGSYTLRANNTNSYFQVEAYKRPSFEVTLDKPASELHFGQSVETKGRVMSYAGYPISNAHVAYTVYCQRRLGMYNQARPAKISSGTLQSALDGSFDIRFATERNKLLKGEQFCTYTITATVTDPKGETQKGTKAITVGDRSLFLTSNINYNQLIDKSKAFDLDVRMITLDGSPAEGTVNYELIRLEQSKDLVDLRDLRTTKFSTGTLVRSGRFQTKEGKQKLDLSTENPGSYRMDYYSLDSQGDTIRLSRPFILFDPNGKKPPIRTYTWTMGPKTRCAVGEKAVVQFGSSAKQVHVLCQVIKVDSILESRWLTLSDEIKTLEIPYLSSYGDRVDVLFSFVKDEQLFNEWMMLVKKKENRKLSPRLTVFRDKLQPGEKAEWTVQIPESQDPKTQAELMVGMYDASLDAIRPHYWSFYTSLPDYIAVIPWNSTISNKFSRSISEKLSNMRINTKESFKIDWMGLSFMPRTMSGLNVTVARVRGVSSMEEVHGVVVEESPVFSSGRIGGLLNEVTVANQGSRSEPIVPIRENFNETAFFYPQLRTDEQGNVRFSFTVPESLTRWNIKMLAHTKNLSSGYSDTTMVTQKDLMVQLNLPRFVRRSDKLVLRASVANLTDAAQKSNVRLALLDPATQKAISLKDSLTKTIELKPRETRFVEWTLTEFAPFELVVCKVLAFSESFSDGEQRYMPVLPDQVLLTETLPMTVRTNQSKSFVLGDLLKKGAQAHSKSLTIEFSPNPVWYAVQALPSLAIPENRNAFDLFTAYYVNSLAAHIAKSNPKLTAVFDQWKLSGGSKEALLSNLEKNKELKSILLEETPWVMAAQDETQQKRQIALLFDLNLQNQQNARYWDEVQKLQQRSGGFSWLTGFTEDRYLTQYILLNKARLHKILGSDATAADNATSKALAYIDQELANDFEWVKKRDTSYLTKRNIGDMQWFYLHVRSEYPQVPIPEFAREAVTYYTKQAEKYWPEATLYGKAATALIASRNKKTARASQILTSLKSYAVKSEEMGMYWARNKPGYFWNQRPVTVQTMLLEAFDELGTNPTDLDEMKIWLLRQKQTQRWDSPLSTVDAIYALLHRGSDWLSSDNQVTIQLDSKKVEPASKEAGTGYFKQVLDGKEVKPTLGQVEVTLKGKSGFGWGALYWQYFQNQDQVKQSGNALHVSKNLFVEQTTPSGKAMLPIDKVALKKGDKVITRLVVSVDRDLEYVALKDLRAACLEPVVQQSGCVWKEGVTYYQTSKDASTQFFFSSLPKGNYVFEYETWVNTAGTFTSGVTTLQCLYAPEFSAHSSGSSIVVSEK